MIDNKKLVPKRRFKGFHDDWEQRKLKDIVVYESSTYSLNEFIDSDNTGVYPIFDANRIIKEINKYDQGEEYISIIKDGSGVGRIDKKPSYSSVIGTMGYLIPNNKEIDFLYCIIKNIDFRKYIIGSTIPHIYFKDYGEVKITIPIIPEQSKVGRFIDLIDKVITLHQRKLVKLKNLKKAYLSKMFPNEEETIPELRFKGFTDDWEQRKLGNIVDRIRRKNTNHESSLPLTISALYGLVDQITYFNNRIASRDVSNYYLVMKGEFAYNKSTSDGFPFGTVKRLDLYENGVLSTLYIVFGIKNHEETSSDFLAVFFDTDKWHKGVSVRAAEGARNHGLLNISADDFMDIELFIPGKAVEQKQIGIYFKKVDNLITLHQRKLEKLKNIKKAYLNEMFV